MIGKVRSTEVSDKEVYVDVNDLIIELLLEMDRCSTEAEQKVYRALVARLTSIRDKAHHK